nr:MAG TPA: Protein of unknown function (DUF2577) [Caudoviricetes sp.]
MAELVQLLKELSRTTNDAGEPFEHRKGTVESVNPISVKVDQKLILEEDDLILTHLVRDYDVDISVSHETEDFELVEGVLTDIKSHKHGYKGRKRITVHNGLKVGEDIVLLKVQGGQTYIVLDRYKDPHTEGEWL